MSQPAGRKCHANCTCLCHDTGGGTHDHQGLPCPGKYAIEESNCGAATNRPDIACRCAKRAEHHEPSHHCRCGATWKRGQS